MVDLVGMVDMVVMVDNIYGGQCEHSITMLNMQKTFGHLKLLLYTSG